MNAAGPSILVTQASEFKRSFPQTVFRSNFIFQGMTELNQCEPRKIKVLGEHFIFF